MSWPIWVIGLIALDVFLLAVMAVATPVQEEKRDDGLYDLRFKHSSGGVPTLKSRPKMSHYTADKLLNKLEKHKHKSKSLPRRTVRRP